MRTIDRIIVHHTAGTWGSAASIDHYHRTQRGFDEIGYHFVIANGWVAPRTYRTESNGCIQPGRDLEKIGAHDLGENETSLGVALVAYDVPTWPQMASLHALVQAIRARFRRPVEVYGHRENEPEETPTACPGARLGPRLGWLREWLAAPRPDRASAELGAVLLPRLPEIGG